MREEYPRHLYVRAYVQTVVTVRQVRANTSEEADSLFDAGEGNLVSQTASEPTVYSRAALMV